MTAPAEVRPAVVLPHPRRPVGAPVARALRRSRRGLRTGRWRAVVQFAAAGLVALAVLSAVGAAALQRTANTQALRAAEELTAIEARALAPAVTDDVVAGDPAALKALDERVRTLVLSEDVLHVKLWDGGGRVLYADSPGLRGQRFTLADDELEALQTGRPASDLSDLSAPENRLDGRGPRLLEVYLRVTTPAGTPLLLEAYLRHDDVVANGRELWRAFAPALLLTLLALELLQLPLAYGLTRRLQRGERERDELHRRALAASDHERRRIAADLHDGVVPTLTAVSYWLASAQAEIDRRCTPEVATTVGEAASTTRESIRALRTLLVDIYPDRLRSAGLETALRDLVGPLEAAGTTARVSVLGADLLPPAVADLLYRTAQEAVRNVVAHARARTVDVTVHARAGRAELVVRDDGVGLAAAPAEEGERHFGLRLLQEAAEAAGGTLAVGPGAPGGTVLRLAVPLT